MTKTHNLGDVLDAHTQQGVDHGTDYPAHLPIWTRAELDHETDPRRWRKCLRQWDKAGKGA